MEFPLIREGCRVTFNQGGVWSSLQSGRGVEFPSIREGYGVPFNQEGCGVPFNQEGC